ncbi:MAG: EAL domain-containing protein [Proteobacteria bacterium]|nr:EAL domain-containing protein [Pseudomonadota bacterium]
MLKDLNAAHTQNEAILDAVPDLLFEMDLEGRYISVHAPRTELLAAPSDQLIGKTVAQILPPEVAGICLAALREANELGYSNGKQFELPLPTEAHWFELSVARKSASTAGAPRFIVLSRDITVRREAEEKIKDLAFFDQLTGLPNRRLLLDRLQQALASCTRSNRQGAVLFIDLNDFKTLNDSRGHDKGDMLLQQVAQRLTTCVREGDTVARLGGDEFIVMLNGLSGDRREAATKSEIAGEKIIAVLNQPYQLAGQNYHSTSSIGITLFGDSKNSVDDLLKRADLAMYQAKAYGRNTLRFFDPSMQAAVTARANMENELHEAVVQHQFLLHYQPQVDAAGHVTGAEALVRWQHPQVGLVLPADFIAIAEETGMILSIGHWVMQTACAQLASWETQPDMSYLTVAVNVSALEFRNPDFVDQVLAVLDATGCNPEKLKLELTESLLVSDVDEVIGRMTALKATGIGFSLDDFGTGYSSLAYLKRMPLDLLKIDRSFVRDVLVDPNDASIAKTIIALAQNLGLGVIAEGVESAMQRDFLASSGCHAYQGYFFSRPLPLDEFEVFVKRV